MGVPGFDRYSSPQNPGLVGYTYAQDDTAQLRPLPVAPRNEINVRRIVRSVNQIGSNRLMGFVQGVKSWTLDSHKLSLIAGLRANYWDFNNQTVVSPRASLGFKPNWKANWSFKLAWGYYHQPAFYREMRIFREK